MKIYLAGKIHSNDWRHDIVDGLRSFQAMPFAEDMYLPERWPVMPRAIFDEHDYVGPFFISCDHGCYHGRNDHGVGAQEGGCNGTILFNEHPSSHITYPDYASDTAREQIVRLCLTAIATADVVFIWVNSNTIYGSLFELGFAAAHKKPIWWATTSGNYDIQDLWFTRTAASDHIVADNATNALRHLLNKHAPKINGYVYLLQSGQHYKIGKTKNVDQRVAQISPRTPLPVSLIHAIGSDDMSWTETYLHRKYARYRTNGEWFSLPEDEVAWLTRQNYIKRGS